MNKPFLVDFHCHTSASGDSLSTPEKVISVARHRGLDHVAITDHNTINGALSAYERDLELVIVGEEIMKIQGEILAFYLSKTVPGGLTPQETIKRFRDQGAFISVSHPFDYYRKGSWNLNNLLMITPLIDAVEVFNARCMVHKGNIRATQFANKYNLAGTAGSDAHVPFEIGAARLELPQFKNSDELRKAIEFGKVRGRKSLLWVHLISRYASLRKRVV